jgi:hypothetical protein
MKRENGFLLAILFLAGAVLVCFSSSAGDDQVKSDGKINLSILYAGKPDSDREKDFVTFLRGYFREVRTGNLKQIDMKTVDKVDVVILDWKEQKLEEISLHCEISLKGLSGKPIVTIGTIGALLCSRNHLKTGYA